MRSQKKKDGKLIGGANASVDLSDVDYIDLGGLILDGRSGSTGIRFRPGYEPVKYQFGMASTGPWHDTMGANDKYRRDSLDGGTTWGDPYQFRGTDGKNGSNANVPTYIKETYIDSVEIRSPTIKANDYYIYPSDENDIAGSFNIYGMYNEQQYHMFQISYYGLGLAPTVRLWSPKDAYVHVGSPSNMLFLDGTLDLEGVSEIRWGNNAPKAVFA